MRELVRDLHTYTWLGHLDKMRSAIEDGVDINAVYSSRPGETPTETPLQTAASSGKVEAFKLLLQLGAGIHAKGEKRDSCLHITLACPSGHDEIGRLSIVAGADIGESMAGGQTMLHVACRRNFLQTAQTLLDRGLDANARDEKGRTPMHDAAHGSARAVLALHEAGGDIDAEDDRARRPLHEAVAHGYPATAQALRALGASNKGIYASNAELEHQMSLSPVANAVLALEPRLILRSLELHPEYDLAKLHQELPLVRSKRFAPVRDLLRSCQARREADRALVDNTLPGQCAGFCPGAAP